MIGNKCEIKLENRFGICLAQSTKKGIQSVKRHFLDAVLNAFSQAKIKTGKENLCPYHYPCQEEEAVEEAYAVIDLKSFYASCECAARGLDIFTTPLAVADPTRSANSIVMSVTPYLKKKYGASNVCRVRDLPKDENLIFAKPRMAYYLEMSAKVVSIFSDFLDEEDIHVYSVDESFLHLTPYLSLYSKTPEELCLAIQRRIKEELGLVATCGIGPNMFLAKICLDNEGKKKPPFMARWGYEDVKTKLWSISPITEIWGISNGIASHLYRIGIRSLKELALADEFLLKREFGVMGAQLHDLANGIDRSDIREEYVPKNRNLSIGQTLMRDYDGKGARLVLREMVDDLSHRLRAAGCETTLVSCYVGYSDCTGFSRQCSLSIHSDDPDALYDAVIAIFNKHNVNKPIRHLGVSFGKIKPYAFRQNTIFLSDEEAEKKRQLNIALDAIKARYGKDACLRASSLTADSTIRQRHKQIGGHRA